MNRTFKLLTYINDIEIFNPFNHFHIFIFNFARIINKRTIVSFDTLFFKLPISFTISLIYL